MHKFYILHSNANLCPYLWAKEEAFGEWIRKNRASQPHVFIIHREIACTVWLPVFSEVRFNPDIHRSQVQRGLSVAVLCPPRFYLEPVACPQWSCLFAAPVESFTPLYAAHLNQGKGVMGFLLLFCLKWRKSPDSLLLKPQMLILSYPASITESNLQESLLLSKDKISFSSQMMSILVVVSD